MPIAEPTTALDLWPRVKALSAWPDTDEGAMADLAAAWTTSGDRFDHAGAHDVGPVGTSWQDQTGQSFVERVTKTLDEVATSAGMMDGLAARATGFAGVVIKVKNLINAMITLNLGPFAATMLLPGGIREMVQEVFVRQLAAFVNQAMAAGAAEIAALDKAGEAPVPDLPEEGDTPPPTDFLTDVGNFGADLLNSMASFGNAALQNPDLALSALGGAGLAALGGAGVVGGIGITGTGVGALPGIGLTALSAAGVATGVAISGTALAAIASNASGADRVTPVPRSAQSYTPPPKNIEAMPQLRPAKPKTPVQGGGGLRKRWVDDKGRIYEWDSQHAELEKYTKNGRHLGAVDPKTGLDIPGKGPDPTRKVTK